MRAAQGQLSPIFYKKQSIIASNAKVFTWSQRIALQSQNIKNHIFNSYCILQLQKFIWYQLQQFRKRSRQFNKKGHAAWSWVKDGLWKLKNITRKLWLHKGAYTTTTPYPVDPSSWTPPTFSVRYLGIYFFQL